MRLWHQSIISKLPRQQLLGQHRECAALRGAGWGRRHSVVNYVFNYKPEHLVAYHYLIMDEMERRGYHPDNIWRNANWRGKTLQEQKDWCNQELANEFYAVAAVGGRLYPEHNDAYLQECLDNLAGKGIIIDKEKL